MLLEHPLIRGAIDEMRNTIIQKSKATGLKDVESREHFHKFLILVDTFEGILRQHVETGTLAARNLEIEREEEEQRRSWLESMREYWKF